MLLSQKIARVCPSLALTLDFDFDFDFDFDADADADAGLRQQWISKLYALRVESKAFAFQNWLGNPG